MMAARYTLVPARGIATSYSFLVAWLAFAMAHATDGALATETSPAEWPEGNVADSSRMHAPPDASTPDIIKYVAEGSSVLLECDIPGWTYCR
jgi:hypothetical protein